MNTSADIRIKKGAVFIYRVFDIGGEIDLSHAEQCLSDDVQKSRFKLPTDLRKSIIIKEAPITVSLGDEKVLIADEEYTAHVSVRIWDYGVISVRLNLPLAPDTAWDKLVETAVKIENSKTPDEIALKHKNRIRTAILPAIKNPTDWATSEDYITYFIEKAEGIASPEELVSKARVAELILAENTEELADMNKFPILDNVLQYSKNDLAVIDWNSALLVEPDGQRDVADVIEFSLTHLLEMRYYDYLLEDSLAKLYDAMETGKESSILSNFYANISHDFSGKFIEFSEFLGRIENSLKTVGDFYLATIFRTTTREFRFSDWQQSIDRKMSTLAKISEILQGELTAKRSHVLEIIVILLIAVELVPLFKAIAQ